MSQELNAVCKICGKPYHYCHDCEKFGSWRLVACSPECWREWFSRVSNRCRKEQSAELGIEEKTSSAAHE